MRWTAVSLAIAFVCVTANQAVAQKTANQVVAQKTANQVVAQKKVALVIGNDKYANEPQLQNPGRDAQLIAAHLEKLGFELVGDRALIDLDKATTDRMVSLFGAKAQDADVALFYFSGHGTQFNGRKLSSSDRCWARQENNRSSGAQRGSGRRSNGGVPRALENSLA